MMITDLNQWEKLIRTLLVERLKHVNYAPGYDAKYSGLLNFTNPFIHYFLPFYLHRHEHAPYPYSCL
jgi:hypothetical protein